MRSNKTRDTQIKEGGQIEVFQILNGYKNISSSMFLTIKEIKIAREHNSTPVKEQSSLDVRKYSFSQHNHQRMELII